MTPADPIAFAALVGGMLDELGIAYVVGGSVASSLYGEPRSTLDLDVMIEADERQVAALAARLSDEFYVDVEEALRAAAIRSSFNAIHFSTSMRIDFFFAEDQPFAREQLARRRIVETARGLAAFYAPEDLVIRKLLWFEAGGRQSERQWRDVVGVLAVYGAHVDRGHLERTARELSLGDLLARALDEARG